MHCYTGCGSEYVHLPPEHSPSLMKILVAYDGSKCSDAAIDDLAKAGLPSAGSAVVISVSETCLPPHETGGPEPHEQERSAEAVTLAAHAKKCVESLFPGWQVKAAAGYGSPAAEILKTEEEMAPDLIIIGSQGLSVVGPFVLGSISQKVLSEARTSVRISRVVKRLRTTPLRLMIAFDGSNGSFAAVNAVASRQWPAGSEIRLVSAAEQVAPPAIGRFVTPIDGLADEVDATERSWLERQAEKALSALKPHELPAAFEILPGNAKQALVTEAARWKADCIFIGADGDGNTTERSLGSTAAAVAARASSSVEIVRVKRQGRRR